MFVDTTLLIDLLRGKQEAINVLQKVEQNETLYTSEINVFELIEGVYIAIREVKEHLEKVFALLSKLVVLPLDRKSAIKAGFISGMLTKKGNKIGETDCLIAGIVIANGITTIITENKAHFDRVPGIEVITY
jgi:predicted nucleic acid-binding protein